MKIPDFPSSKQMGLSDLTVGIDLTHGHYLRLGFVDEGGGHFVTLKSITTGDPDDEGVSIDPEEWRSLSAWVSEVIEALDAETKRMDEA